MRYTYFLPLVLATVVVLVACTYDPNASAVPESVIGAEPTAGSTVQVSPIPYASTEPTAAPTLRPVPSPSITLTPPPSPSPSLPPVTPSPVPTPTPTPVHPTPTPVVEPFEHLGYQSISAAKEAAAAYSEQLTEQIYAQLDGHLAELIPDHLPAAFVAYIMTKDERFLALLDDSEANNAREFVKQYASNPPKTTIGRSLSQYKPLPAESEGELTVEWSDDSKIPTVKINYWRSPITDPWSSFNKDPIHIVIAFDGIPITIIPNYGYYEIELLQLEVLSPGFHFLTVSMGSITDAQYAAGPYSIIIQSGGNTHVVVDEPMTSDLPLSRSLVHYDTADIRAYFEAVDPLHATPQEPTPYFVFGPDASKYELTVLANALSLIDSIIWTSTGASSIDLGSKLIIGSNQRLADELDQYCLDTGLYCSSHVHLGAMHSPSTVFDPFVFFQNNDRYQFGSGGLLTIVHETAHLYRYRHIFGTRYDEFSPGSLHLEEEEGVAQYFVVIFARQLLETLQISRDSLRMIHGCSATKRDLSKGTGERHFEGDRVMMHFIGSTPEFLERDFPMTAAESLEVLRSFVINGTDIVTDPELANRVLPDNDPALLAAQNKLHQVLNLLPSAPIQEGACYYYSASLLMP